MGKVFDKCAKNCGRLCRTYVHEKELYSYSEKCRYCQGKELGII